jgi:hypothetical protein
MSVNICHTTLRHSPENDNIHIDNGEKLQICKNFVGHKDQDYEVPHVDKAMTSQNVVRKHFKAPV